MSVGYQYGQIVRAMMYYFFWGGDRTEDINSIKRRKTMVLTVACAA